MKKSTKATITAALGKLNRGKYTLLIRLALPITLFAGLAIAAERKLQLKQLTILPQVVAPIAALSAAGFNNEFLSHFGIRQSVLSRATQTAIEQFDRKHRLGAHPLQRVVPTGPPVKQATLDEQDVEKRDERSRNDEQANAVDGS